MNDTTWFWQIVDARGLADVSSDEFVALNELISKAEQVDACAEYLKPGETPRERMDRDHADVLGLMKLLAQAREALTTAESERDELLREKERLERERDEAREALIECEGYFDNRADADCDQDGFVPNKEMRLLAVVREAIASTSRDSGRNLADAHSKSPAPSSQSERIAVLCPHAPTYDAGLCCGHPDDCTFVRPSNLSKEENDA